MALIFLIDRYTFWTGTCKAALSVLSYIEKQCPNVPVPPQVVIRKARVLKNDGDIQGKSNCLSFPSGFKTFLAILKSICGLEIIHGAHLKVSRWEILNGSFVFDPACNVMSLLKFLDVLYSIC